MKAPEMQWSTIVQSAAIGAVVASVVTAIINLVNTNRTMKFQGEENRKTLEHQAAQTRATIEHQSDLARLADQRALRDAKRERLRSIYTTILVSAHAVYNQMADIATFVPYDSVDELLKHQERTRKQAATEVDARRAMTELALETDATDFEQTYWSIASAWLNYRNFQKARQLQPANVTDADLKGLRDTVGEAIQKMESMARQRLAELEQPIGGTMQTSQATAQRSASTIQASS